MTAASAPGAPPPGRWPMLAGLLGFAFFAYVERTSIAVAGERMMPELGITQVELGWLLTVFLGVYTTLQIPAGWVGEYLGARVTLAGASIVSLVATALTVVSPSLFHGGILICALLVARALLGAAQAPVFPIAAGAIETWFPRHDWGLAQGLFNSGLNFGAAVTPPVVAYLMATHGWQTALLVSSAPVLVLTVYWYVRAQDRPPEAEGDRSHACNDRKAARAGHGPAPSLGRVWALIADRDLMGLSASYLSMNFVFYLLTFWSFLYFVQERHFSIIEGGWMAAAPFIAAGLGAACGGRVSDVACRRLGDRWGFRAVPLVALPLSAAALYGALCAASPTTADLALCVAFAMVEITEGAYWAGAMRIAGSDTMIATGVLNTAGNIGGIIGTPIVAAFSAQQSWSSAFLMGSACTVLAALLWLRVDAGVATSRSRGSETSAPALPQQSI